MYAIKFTGKDSVVKVYHVAVVGATGAVGNEMVKILEERKFPVGSITLLASERSIGKALEFNGKSIPIQLLTENSFSDSEFRSKELS